MYYIACVLCPDDDNRIVLEVLPAEVTGDDGDTDYVNAYMGDYINASYIDVGVQLHVFIQPLTCMLTVH